MKLSVIMAQLESGELNNLSCVDQETKKVKPSAYKTIVEMVNSGVIDLHGRFPMKMGYLDVPLSLTQETYSLPVIEPGIQRKLMRIQEIHDQCGHPIGMNDHTNRRSVYTTDSFTLHVPSQLRTHEHVTSLRVSYRRMPKPLPTCDDGFYDFECMEVDLDYPYMLALCYFIASRLHGPVGLQDSTHSINSYVSLYNAECNRLEEANLSQDSIAVNDRPRKNGWP